ncbi:MAG TPA: TrmH family RNA methyltransferase [Gaiellaceae bacterium]|nr:TrmH family RNA methyltransferase [Gaiellaceae bacterium]
MSSANVRLKAVRRLARRGAPGLCLAEGTRSVRAALAAGAAVEELYVARDLLAGRDGDLVAAVERCGTDVVELGAAAFASLTERRPDGLLAVVRRPSTALDALDLPREPLVAVAVAIERPGNLGAIARTACAAGADVLLVADKRTDVFHRDAIRGSVGAVFRLPCVTVTTEQALAWLHEQGIAIVATTPAAAAAYWTPSYAGPVAVAFGSERHGLPRAWLEAAEEQVAVPAHGPVDSLNVAVAAGVVLCEAARARASADGRSVQRQVPPGTARGTRPRTGGPARRAGSRPRASG